MEEELKNKLIRDYGVLDLHLGEHFILGDFELNFGGITRDQLLQNKNAAKLLRKYIKSLVEKDF